MMVNIWPTTILRVIPIPPWRHVDAEDLVAARKVSGDLYLGARGKRQRTAKQADVFSEHAMHPSWPLHASYFGPENFSGSKS